MSTTTTVNTLSRERIKATFDPLASKIFTRAELNRIVSENIAQWRAAGRGSDIVVKTPTVTGAIKALLAQTELRETLLDFPYRATRRFTWGEAPLYPLLQSVDEASYFSHFTAMYLHGVTDQIPKTIYLNVEQPAAGGGGELTQEGIDRAFRGKCRVSNNITALRGFRVCKLNGKNTGRLGVISRQFDEGYETRLTNLERTLLDATVRPVYAGGVTEVAKAFRAAAASLSVNKMVAYLRKMKYTYPYHQAIGFYLEQSGAYSPEQVAAMRQFPIAFDFYLTYQMKDPEYNVRWRLFVPQGF